MEFTVLGPVRAIRGGESLVLGGPRQQAVFAVLLVAPNRAVPVDRLIDEVWGNSAASEARDSLYVYVSNLRRILGTDRLQRATDGYQLRVRPGELDSESFEREVVEGRGLLEAAPRFANEILERALGRWYGDAYQGVDVPSVSLEAERLAERRLGAREDRLEALLAVGRHHDVTPELHELCEQHPLRERLWGLSMLALYRDARQAEALAAYGRLQTLLAEELGIQPSAEVRRLEEQILLQDPSLELANSIPNNLPAPLSGFVDRRQEMVDAGALLAETRLLTLTGEGGSGKTCLGLELARAALHEHPDGAWLVELDRLRDPTGVPGAIADTLDIPLPDETDPVEVLGDTLKERKMLIVLDNFEHVIQAAPFVSALLAAAPGVRILVTSRERLRVSGEQLYEVPPLRPAAAASLFVDRAQAVDPGFRLTDDNARHIVAICRDLDGLPLPIELAAARVDVLPPAALRKRLRSRLGTLKGGLRDHPTRQQTLRDTIDWSYDLLGTDEQQLFSSLAVFEIGASLEAIEAVCSPGMSIDVLDGLQSLTEKSLVRQHPGPDGGPRFSLRKTVREYAGEILDEQMNSRTLRQAHCDYYVHLAEQTGTLLRDGSRAAGGWELLNADIDNYRVALSRAFTDGDPLQGARLLGSLHFHRENESWSELNRWEEVAFEHADELEPAARARLYLALARSHAGNWDTRRLCEEALTWARAAGNLLLIARATYNVALTYVGDDEHRELALGLCRQAIEESRTAEAPGFTAHAYNALGEVARSQGDDETAGQAYEEALRLSREVGNRTLTVLLLLNLAFVAEHRSNHSESERLAHEALSDAGELGDQTLIAWGLEGVALAAVSAGMAGRGARLLGATDQAHAALGIHRAPAERPEYERARTRLGELLPPGEIDALEAEGRRMTRPEAVAYALGQTSSS